MAKKTVAAKKRNVKVDAYGQAHIHSSFNNIIVLPIAKDKLLAGLLQVRWDSEALKRILLMPLKWQLRIVLR